MNIMSLTKTGYLGGINIPNYVQMTNLTGNDTSCWNWSATMLHHKVHRVTLYILIVTPTCLIIVTAVVSQYLNKLRSAKNLHMFSTTEMKNPSLWCNPIYSSHTKCIRLMAAFFPCHHTVKTMINDLSNKYKYKNITWMSHVNFVLNIKSLVSNFLSRILPVV